MCEQAESRPRLTEQLTHVSLEELLRKDREREEKAEAKISWFHGRISRQSAERILRKGITDHAGVDNLFLVRETTGGGQDFVLSMIHGVDVFHFVMYCKCECHFQMSNGPLIHGLDLLIKRCMEENHGLPHKLTRFCQGNPPPHRARKFGYTNTLHRAVAEGNVLQTRAILASKNCPDVNKKTDTGSTALHDASYYGHQEIVSMLIEGGADIEMRDSGAYTALARACCGGHANVVVVLLIQGKADPQETCAETGWVPLHEAAMRGHTECVKVLLAFDAPLMSRTHEGETPRDVAVKYHKLQCADILARYKIPKPQLKKDQWYHKDLNRQGAEDLFERHEYQEGLFLIRPNSKCSDMYVLSLCCKNSTFNYQISPAEYMDQPVYYIDFGPFLPSLEHVVYHYSQRRDGLPCRLKRALSPDGNIVEVSMIAPNEQDNEYSCYKNLTPGLPPRTHTLSNPGATKPVRIPGAAPPLPSTPPPNSRTKDIFLNMIPLEKIKRGDILGEGEYGTVYKGVLVDVKKKRDVAIKCFHDDQVNVRDDFLKEATTMQMLDHKHIVKLLGVSEGPPLMMLQEFVAMGSMLDFLLNFPDKIRVDVELSLWASQIASGMMYLEEKHLVHRDLAARNILLKSKSEIKISDFGLSRATGADNDYYKASRGGRWPIKWYAPECVNYGQFSHASDVWSYGITLWEMYSFGEPPYGDKRGAEVIKDIENGYRLTKPKACKDKVYEIMLKCWASIPAARPIFSFLHQQF